MTRANKLGSTAAACAVLACLPPYEPWKQPVNALLFVLACMLGYSASRTGNRWWLAIPATIGAILLTVLIMAFRSYN